MKLASTVATATKRYVLNATAPVRDQDGALIGAAGIGADKRGSALVFESGQTQSAVPVAALVAALVTPSVIPVSAIADAFEEAGTLDKLAAAIDTVRKARA